MLDEVPPFLGAAAVVGIQVIAECGGLAMLLTRWPQLYMALQCIGVGCLVYLGWQLLRQRGTAAGSAGEFSTFWEAASLQFLNPKTWLMSLAAATLLLPLPLEHILTDGHVGTI